MFTYINPDVRERLVSDGKLVRIDLSGELLKDQDKADVDEGTINLLGPIPLPIQLNDKSVAASWYAAVRSTELDKVESLAGSLKEGGGQNLFATLAAPMAVNSALVFGNPTQTDNPLVRVHSGCLTGDVFGSERCECGPQLALAIARISDDPSGGIVIYMAGHEGRGIGLWAKAATYLLQDTGENTYQANESLGLPTDSRNFTDAAALILHFLGNRPMRILTNNPKKIEDLTRAGLTHMKIEKHVAGVSKWNKRYLFAKQNWGHDIGDSDIED